MSCHCACLKGNEIKVIMTPGGATPAQDIHLSNAYLDGNVLVLVLNNGETFRVDLSGLSPQPIETLEFQTKNGELFITLNDEIFEVKEEKEGE